MAKTSMIVKNQRRRERALRQRPERLRLRKITIDPNQTFEEREEAQRKLQAMNRNGAMSRVVNRCQVTGRPKAVYKKFMLSRITLREMAHQGQIPGMKKSSF